MATYSTRSPPPLQSTSNYDAVSQSQRPAKKASFLSLRKEKRATTADPSAATSNTGRARAGSHSSPSPSAFYTYEDNQAPALSRPGSSRAAHTRKQSKSSIRTHDEATHHTSRSKTRHPTGETPEREVYAFPTSGDRTSYSSSYSHPKHRTRGHSPPGSSKYDQIIPTFLSRPLKYSILDSASSTLSQYEDVPRTPVDELSFREPIFPPVMVAAPVAGVETMDALVDGMNGHFGADDHYMGFGRMSNRTKVSKSGHHPLYHPPLPTPPPGIVLGKAPMQRRPPESSESEEERPMSPSSRRSSKQRRQRTASSRQGSISNIVDIALPRKSSASAADSVASPRTSIATDQDSIFSSRQSTTSSTSTPIRTVAPSISDIIRTHAPAVQQARIRSTTNALSPAHATVHEVTEPEPSRTEDEGDLISRSSVDTIAEEIRRTLVIQKRASVVSNTLRPQRSFQRPPVLSVHSEIGPSILSSPRSEGRPTSSIFSYSTMSEQPPLPPLDFRGLTKVPSNNQSQAIAQYLRSARLTTLLTLNRRPHASREAPLTVSLSDLGSPSGYPLVVFLGLGCVRHVMGLYDEMAECLGIRLITIDRWGLGRTDVPRSKSAHGILEWASVVEEVLDKLNIDQCSVMAHSAGAPYALAFANKYPERIRGDVCLLAPWVGGNEGSSGYKWLKYVPNGILKTAQAAEWKIQAWMIGKPPTFAFEGIGFDASAPISPEDVALYSPSSRPPPSPLSPMSSRDTKYPANAATAILSARKDSSDPRPSMSSGLFSDYDDLRDFEGRFESRTSLDTQGHPSQRKRTVSDSKRALRKTSRSFLNKLKGTPTTPQSPPTEEKSGPGKRLKALRSMGSLRGKSRPSSSRAVSQPEVPSLPAPASPDVSFESSGFDWLAKMEPVSTPSTIKAPSSATIPTIPDFADEFGINRRAQGRRSVSFGATEHVSRPEPSPISLSQPSPLTPSASYQASLGSALIAASHAESAKGTHQDLLKILNHDRQPWGFSYHAYPHTVRVWYGDRDERIAENAVRWMENAMGTDKCKVEVVKGADHALMYKSGLVVDILEQICRYWHEG